MYVKINENRNKQPLRNEAYEKGLLKHRIDYNEKTELYELYKYIEDKKVK